MRNVIAILLSLTAAACSFDPDGLPAGADAGADAAGPIPCVTHADCEAVGLDCTNDRCMQGFCKSYDTCAAMGLTCLPGEGDAADACGTPPECDADADCDDDSPCTDDYCVEGKCETQSNCPSGQVCTTGGSCQTPPQCDEDADCPDTDPSSCMVPDCNASGTCAVVSSCPSGRICTASGCVTPGTPGVTLSSMTLAATEGGATGSYTIVLTSAPASNVSVTVNPNAQVSVSASTLTFTPANWSTAQTVTITAVDDAAVEGAHTGTIAHGVGSADPAYNGLSVPSVTVNVTDNDAVPSNPTIVCSLVSSTRTKMTVSGPNIRQAFYGLATYDPTTSCYLQAGFSESATMGSAWPPYALVTDDSSKPWVSDGSSYELIPPDGADEINIAASCPTGSPTYFDVTPTNGDGVGLRFAVSNATNGFGTATCQVLCASGGGSCAISIDGEY